MLLKGNTGSDSEGDHRSSAGNTLHRSPGISFRDMDGSTNGWQQPNRAESDEQREGLVKESVRNATNNIIP